MLLKNQMTFGRGSCVKSQTSQFELSNQANFPKCWRWVSPPSLSDSVPASPGAASCHVWLPGAVPSSHLAEWQLWLSHAAALGSLGSFSAPAPLLGFKPPCWGAVLKSHQVSLAMHWIQRVELIPHFSSRGEQWGRSWAWPLARR